MYIIFEETLKFNNIFSITEKSKLKISIKPSIFPSVIKVDFIDVSIISNTQANTKKRKWI